MSKAPATQAKTDQEISAMRVSGRMLMTVLDFLVHKQLKAGITTRQLATAAAQELAKLGGKPAFLGFEGYGDVICISVNEEVVHGIPGDLVINEGDIVGLDFGVNYNGMITDGAVTAGVGHLSTDAKRLLKGTEQALQKGIAMAKAGNRIGDISFAIESRLKADGLGVVEDLIGHGVGHSLHEEPGIPNYGRAGQGPLLIPGMTIAIEPMATLGGKAVSLDEDGWTVRTTDGSWAAQFEHTVLITDGDPEILTKL